MLVYKKILSMDQFFRIAIVNTFHNMLPEKKYYNGASHDNKIEIKKHIK